MELLTGKQATDKQPTMLAGVADKPSNATADSHQRAPVVIWRVLQPQHEFRGSEAVELILDLCLNQG